MPPKGRKKITKNKHNAVKCKECSEEVVTDDEDSIECNTCNRWIHFQCSNLNKKQLAKIMENEDSEFKCHFCSKGNKKSTADATLQTLLSKINDLTSIVKEQTKRYDELFRSIDKQKNRINLLEKENRKLRSSLDSVTNDQRVLFSEINRNKIIIKGLNVQTAGVPEIKKCVLDMAAKGGSDIVINDISDVKLLLGRKTEHSKTTAIISFTRLIRNLILFLKGKLFAEMISTKMSQSQTYYQKRSRNCTRMH